MVLVVRVVVVDGSDVPTDDDDDVASGLETVDVMGLVVVDDEGTADLFCVDSADSDLEDDGSILSPTSILFLATN